MRHLPDVSRADLNHGNNPASRLFKNEDEGDALQILFNAAMDPEQQDEQFFQVLESEYNRIIENHTHPEESMETPPDSDCAWSHVQTLPLDLPDLPPFPE